MDRGSLRSPLHDPSYTIKSMPRIPIFEKKNVLVTGGAGFIGSHLCEELLREAKVICMDNLVSGSLRNIEHLLQSPDFIFIKHDISEPIDFKNWPELKKFKILFQGVQEIYQLACPTAPKDFEKYRTEMLKANSVGMTNVLDLALQWKAKVLFTSSSVIYGPRSAEGGYISEDYRGSFDHLSTRACYDEGKRFAEAALTTYAQVHGLDIRIARVFRTYGPRTRLRIGEMVPDFILDALAGKSLTVYGDKNFQTSLCYISDMVNGLIKLMNTDKDPGPVNLGSDQDVNLVKLAQDIIALTNSSSKIIFQPQLLFMRSQPLPDISRARESLGWFPVTRLEDGLAQMIEYTRGQEYILGVK